MPVALTADIAIGAALAIGLGAVGTGVAQSHIGAAVVGAVAEKEEFFAKGLIFLVIPETLVIFGLIISLQILNMGATP